MAVPRCRRLLGFTSVTLERHITTVHHLWKLWERACNRRPLIGPAAAWFTRRRGQTFRMMEYQIILTMPGTVALKAKHAGRVEDSLGWMSDEGREQGSAMVRQRDGKAASLYQYRTVRAVLRSSVCNWVHPVVQLERTRVLILHTYPQLADNEYSGRWWNAD